ncbi:MAG: CoA transferase [Dehalococcoidia bacterium]|nr:CoA transferase [Dehalococcoidia bacterium]MDW8008923.1 CoA transferase [Chloroflexota bacterium]
MGPLEGIRVINWSQFTPSGAAAILGDLGADVIKVEHPERGDAYRGMAAMYGEAMNMAGGRHVGFEAVNRNQRSITLNLASPEGRELFCRLVAVSDVLITNFEDRVRRKHRVDYDDLAAINPRLIYAVSSNFGPRGPLAGRRGFDQVAQARSGLMWAMGDREQEEPVQVVGGICDQMAATVLVMGILAALVARERDGMGQRLDSSLLGSMIHLQSIGLTVASLRGRGWSRHDRRRTRNPLTNHYRCADGKWILFGEIQADRFWGEFCRALGLEELEHDPRFATAMGGRRENAEELIRILDRTLATKTREEWIRIFEEQQVSFAYSPVQDYQEVLEDPQARENGYLVEYDHPAVGHPVRLVGHPVQYSRTPASIRRPAPEFGEHTEEVLSELLGCSWEEIAELRSKGAI